MELSLKKNFRVKREKDFKAIFKDGTSFANRKFVVYQLENQQNHFRVGLSGQQKAGECSYQKSNQETNPAHSTKCKREFSRAC